MVDISLHGSCFSGRIEVLLSQVLLKEEVVNFDVETMTILVYFKDENSKI